MATRTTKKKATKKKVAPAKASAASKGVDAFVKAKVLPEYRPIVAALRRLMRECVPDAVEGVSYGVPMYKRNRGIAVISPTKKGITFAFSRGAAMADKYKLLEGVGTVSKNVRMSSLDEVNEAALRYYLAQAVKLDDAVKKPKKR